MHQLKNVHSLNPEKSSDQYIDGNTKIFGLLGQDLSYSLSFHLHNSAFQHFGFNSIYVPLIISDIRQSESFLEGLLHGYTSFMGCNITIPYKTRFVHHELLQLSTNVKNTLSMNTLIKKGDFWLAENSDILGFIKSISHIDFENRDILILGAGGVARSVVYALREEINLNNSIYIFNRTQEKSKILSQKYDLQAITTLQKWPHKKDGIIINCTSIGQGTQSSLMSFTDDRPFHKNQIVIDVIYQQTPLLQKASRNGAIFYNGLSMLIWQAAISFSWWTGVSVDECYSYMYQSYSSMKSSNSVQHFQQNKKGHF